VLVGRVAKRAAAGAILAVEASGGEGASRSYRTRFGLVTHCRVARGSRGPEASHRWRRTSICSLRTRPGRLETARADGSIRNLRGPDGRAKGFERDGGNHNSGAAWPGVGGVRKSDEAG